MLARRKYPLERDLSHRPGPLARPKGLIIKRVAAVAGEPLPGAIKDCWEGPKQANVPEANLILLGDNADHSSDSREHGYYPLNNVLGAFVRRLGGDPIAEARPPMGP
ncbi:hypothetical protein GCM10010411_93790 [Actinomadura fulvescens]|uniref:Peptidase S26 domain-containing protein n=1 Tax=Actinomadura fulvescens TaxID=46160 RepID=A0ABN3R0D8_9ACTN